LAEKALKDLGFAERRGMDLSSIETIKNLVSCGMGLALVSEYCVKKELDAGQLVTSQLLQTFTLTTGIVWLKNRSMSQVTKLMRDFILTSTGNNAYSSSNYFDKS
jgi:DNA-binding transcriptional LysR family regulator